MQCETGETGSACVRLCVGPAAYFDVKRDDLARRQLTWCRAVEVQERKARTVAPGLSASVYCCPARPRARPSWRSPVWFGDILQADGCIDGT